MTDALFLLDTNKDDAPVLANGIEEGWTLSLPQHVKRHAISAMRLSDGDSLDLSDGKGVRIHATITDSENGLVTVDSFIKEPAPTTRLALIQALAKTGHDEQAIDMATQIGVDEVFLGAQIGRFQNGSQGAQISDGIRCLRLQRSNLAERGFHSF